MELTETLMVTKVLVSFACWWVISHNMEWDTRLVGHFYWGGSSPWWGQMAW